MQQTPEALQRITARTLAHYDQNAQGFWEGTRDHDVSQNIDALLTDTIKDASVRQHTDESHDGKLRFDFGQHASSNSGERT